MKIKCKFYKHCDRYNNTATVCLNGGGGYCGEYRRREKELKQ